MPSADLWLPLLLAAPFVASLTAALLPPDARNRAAGLATAAMLTGLLVTIGMSGSLVGPSDLDWSIPWAPSLGLVFQLSVNGLSWIFLVLIFGVGLLVSIYARYYMSADDPVPRFYSLLLAFAGSMAGIVLSGNVVQLVVFWEMTSLLSFLLIGYWHHGAAAREGARMALIVTSAGGLCLLAGLLVLAGVAGGYEIDTILAAGDEIRASPAYGPALGLILIGAFTKSAQFPFHFWLPQAMAAPTPVSAYLHSATLVKAGIFLLMQFWPVLSGTESWFYAVTVVGLTTLALGAFLAMFQNDLKGVLAFSTISHLGLITFLLGLGSPLAWVAALFHTVNHAVFKASLFMAAGAVDHEAGTRDMRRLRGLARFMPVTTALATVAAAAMAGVPLLNGFLSKEMFFEESLIAGRGLAAAWLPAVVAVVASTFSVVYSLRFAGGVFFGPAPSGLPRTPSEPPVWMVAPIGCLALLCVIVGVAPALTMGPGLERAAVSILGDRAPAVHLSAWHGPTPALLMSGVALTGGLILYLAFRRRLLAIRKARFGPVDGKLVFERALQWIGDTAPAWIKHQFPGERLQPQVLLVLVAALAGGLAAAGGARLPGSETLSSIDPAFAILWLIGCACALGAAGLAKFHRLAALILVGGVGLVSCISFVWLSAPDLATTQLLVEVVTTILILLGLRWLPPRRRISEPGRLTARLRRVRDGGLAVTAGLGMSVLAYAVMTHPVDGSISEFFLAAAYERGGGRNVVNVILVDFRGFDTFGEITVLAIVALAVFSLLRRFRPAQESVKAPPQKQAQDLIDERREDRTQGQTLTDYMRVPGLIIMLIVPVILLFAAHLFVRGHELPGGGFAAGLTTSVALILLYMGGGVRWVEQRVGVAPVQWIATGLLIALATGLGSWAFGYPFLTSWFTYLELGVLGRIPMATAVLFDLGVFILVVGSTTLMLIAIAHQSLRRPRRPDEPEVNDTDEAL